jgi:uncharacterized protein with von Willebrand factor type A (vWA) domain
MQKKRLISLVLMGITAGFAINAQAESATALKADNKMMDCSKMSADEQAFAKKLSSSNRDMFCGKFSSSQRKAAMKEACHDAAKCEGREPMSEDDAVEKVMKQNNME